MNNTLIYSARIGKLSARIMKTPDGMFFYSVFDSKTSCAATSFPDRSFNLTIDGMRAVVKEHSPKAARWDVTLDNTDTIKSV